ncbi:methyltransferase domain-containing protein [Amycolatopsis sp. NPDC026612]|uniref:methyltransferase domain-containing protein n=1 Tax=Amycolatopsis sp. NPDC026612 TaxID=3155466 RepID=UPI0033FCF849
MGGVFDELVAEASAVSVEGWDFSWLDGRATEARPSWGYQRLLGERLSPVSAALDLETGGGEVLDGCPSLPPVSAATESWAPNIAKASARLRPRGVLVVATAGIPFADDVFDLVSSRHPVRTQWAGIARVLRPGGTYFSQQVGPASVFEAVVYFLRKVIWLVPGFTVERYRDKLRELHELIERDGPFVAHATRFLIEARKP